ncbi:MAG: CotH kinase family protein [Deltaproteobacteria bacterium]|uniref:CotH kinase family protein n=1 Tax=Desulfobacula sp. TaxID=2593537 RepID=UPI0019A1F6EB|nr:CotH kinase family protein [Candidatus Desulfobacula maris]MBL6992771.1 CotH kinase family protein [Desulfobacula sp.]
MKIQLSNSKNRSSGGILKKIIQKTTHLSGAALLFAAILFSFYMGGIAHKEGFFGQVLKPAIETNIRIPYRYLRSLLTIPEQLSLDIKHLDYQKLAFKREQALKTGVLHSSKEDFVSAKIRWNNTTTNVAVRLKGDLEDHWADKSKWSFRVKTKKKKTILGMREFSLQHPKTRGFFNDWFLHKLLNHLGDFIVLRYEFVQLSVNGKDLGIYLLEEHFDDKLLVNNNYVKAPIIRIKDHLLWYGIDPKFGFTKSHLNEHYTISPIDAFNTGQISRDKVQRTYFNQAKNLLESFRLGRLSTHEVFDVKKMAQLFAVIDLLGYHHSTAYSNIRFYYNPVTSLLDPIGYDNTFIMKAENIEGEGKEIRSKASKKVVFSDYESEQLWYNRVFEDEVFVKHYISQLENIGKKSFLDTFFSKVNGEYETALNLLYRTFPGYNFKYRQTLYNNQEYIRTVLNPIEAVQAYYHAVDIKNHLVSLELGNIQSLPIEISGVSGPNGFFAKVDTKTILQPKQKLRFIRFQEVTFQLPVTFEWNFESSQEMSIVYSTLGSSKKFQTKINPWSHLDSNKVLTNVGQVDLTYTAYPFFKENLSDKTITIEPGNWVLDRSIKIPEGFVVICNNGTSLNLINSTRIISYSPLNFQGTEEQPIIITSTDKTGQGIFVLGAAIKSKLTHVIFRDLTSPPVDTSPVIASPLTFYETSVDLNQCSFEDCLPGFAVSLVRSDFHIGKTAFFMCGNAIKVYNSNGSISNLLVDQCMQYGIKSVSSTILADEISFKNIKGIALESSAGSLVRLKQGYFDKSDICISVNDGSRLDAHGITFSASNVGVIVHKKIPDSEQGGQAILTGVDFVDVKERFELDKTSSLTIDNIPMASNTSDVRIGNETR